MCDFDQRSTSGINYKLSLSPKLSTIPSSPVHESQSEGTDSIVQLRSTLQILLRYCAKGISFRGNVGVTHLGQSECVFPQFRI